MRTDDANGHTRPDRIGLAFRRATRADVPAVVALLSDDVLGASRELSGEGSLEAYRRAFEEIAADPNQYLCVATLSDEIVGTLQLTFIPGLSRAGATRGQIESVRVSGAHRGKGIGESLFAWAIDQCRERECSLMQLTSDRQRDAAQRFYERLGFEASHIGYKLKI